MSSLAFLPSFAFSDSVPSITESWLKGLLEIVRRENGDHLSPAVAVLDLLVGRVEDPVKGSLTVGPELVVSSFVLLSVLVILEETGRVILVVSIAKVVDLIAKSVLHILLKLRWVLLLVDVKLASCILELVGGDSVFTTLCQDLVDSSLDAGA